MQSRLALACTLANCRFGRDYSILGLYRDNGKQNGNYRDYIGVI